MQQRAIFINHRARLPSQSDGIKSVDLKSPNELTEEERVAASRSHAPAFCVIEAGRVSTPRAPVSRSCRVDGRVYLTSRRRRAGPPTAAAIGGTLLMLIPVAYYDSRSWLAVFAISALLGGGLGATVAPQGRRRRERASSAVVNKVKEAQFNPPPKCRRRRPGRSRTGLARDERLGLVRRPRRDAKTPVNPRALSRCV